MDDFFQSEVEFVLIENNALKQLGDDLPPSEKDRKIFLRLGTAIAGVGLALTLFVRPPVDLSQVNLTPGVVAQQQAATSSLAAPTLDNDHGKMSSSPQAVDKLAKGLAQLDKIDSIDHLL